MDVFNLEAEQRFNPDHRVERKLARVEGGDQSVACWEPGQFSPYHCHPYATEIYFCFSGGGTMRTPQDEVAIVPGSFVVHPPGELHEFETGPQRTLLFRVRYGSDMLSRHYAWRDQPGWTQSEDDAAYFREHPVQMTG